MVGDGLCGGDGSHGGEVHGTKGVGIREGRAVGLTVKVAPVCAAAGTALTAVRFMERRVSEFSAGRAVGLTVKVAPVCAAAGTALTAVRFMERRVSDSRRTGGAESHCGGGVSGCAERQVPQGFRGGDSVGFRSGDFQYGNKALLQSTVFPSIKPCHTPDKSLP